MDAGSRGAPHRRPVRACVAVPFGHTYHVTRRTHPAPCPGRRRFPGAPGRPGSGVMMIPIPKDGIYESVEGTDRAAAVPWIEDVVITAKEGQRILPLPEGSSYLGFIFARGDSAETVDAALRRAHVELRFHIATALPTFRPSS